MNTNYSTKSNLTILGKNGVAVRKIILSNNNVFYSFAKALGAANEMSLFLARFNDQKLNKVYYGREMKEEHMSEHTPIIGVRKGEDGIDREVVIPWEKATQSERDNFDMPIKKLFEKVLDIMVRSFVKASLEVKAAEGFSLLTAPIYPKTVTVEDALRLAVEIEDFRKDYLSY